MYETYPKGSANPSSSVGEQHTTQWNVSPDITYPGTGAAGTSYTGDRSHTKVCKGGSGSKNKSDFPGTKYETFGTEKVSR